MEREQAYHLEHRAWTLTPPLETIPCTDELTNIISCDGTNDQPMPYTYLINLFSANDMRASLNNEYLTDDVYSLPIHLQSLICEAKEEAVIELSREKQGRYNGQHEDSALRRLEQVREYVWLKAGHDLSLLLPAIIELVTNDDRLYEIIH